MLFMFYVKHTKHSKTVSRLFHHPLLTLRNGVGLLILFLCKNTIHKVTLSLLVNEFISFYIGTFYQIVFPLGNRNILHIYFPIYCAKHTFPVLYLFKARSRSRHLFSTSYIAWCFSDYTLWEQEWVECERFREYLKSRWHLSCLLLQPRS